MPEILATTALVWENAAAIFSDATVLQWETGATVYSEGGAFTPAAPPGGGTATAPNLDARALVAAAAVYNISTPWAVVDLRDGLPVEVDSLSFNSDEDALFWAVTLTGGQALYDKMAAGEQPPSVGVTLNGQEWRFVIEDLPLQRRHGEVAARAQGRSLTCLAGAPYQLEQNWSLSGATTALQLATAANTGTELQVEWGLTDWPIPDGVFSHAGTPLSVVKRVADAVGAMVQSDPKEYAVKVLPRYDLLPNEWPTVPPDVEIAEDAIESDGYEDASKPAYDGVYVFGQQGGAAAFVRLAGTSGANLKPMVTDALLTHLDACSQRGMAELARSGEQRRHTMTLPVFSAAGQPGVLTVGRIVKIGGTAPWWGIVRSVSVQARHDGASQTVVVERHTRLVDGLTYGVGITSPLRFEGPIPAQTVFVGAVMDLNLSTYFAAGVPAYAYAMRSGALPAWLELNRNTGHVIGTAPSTPVATTTVRFRATDSVNSTADTGDVAITVLPTEVRVFAVGSGGRRMATAASGTSAWTAPSIDAPYASGVRGAYDGTRLVVSAAAGGLWHTASLGESWANEATITDFANAYTGPFTAKNRLCRTSHGFIVPLIRNSATSGQLKNWASTDGVTWSLVSPTSYPTSADRVWQCHVVGNTIYAVAYFAGSQFPPGGGQPLSDAYSSVLASTDGGYTWTALVTFDPAVFFIRRVLVSEEVIVLLADFDTYINTGVSDRRSATGWGGPWVNGAATSDLFDEIAAAYGSVLVGAVGNTSRLFVSTNAGASWTDLTLPPGVPYGSLTADIIHDGTAFLVLQKSTSNNTAKVLRSVDGTTWVRYDGPDINPAALVIAT